MKYKENIRVKLDEIDASLIRLQYQIRRGVEQDQQEETLEAIKEKLSDTKAMIELEEDNWAPRF